MTDHPERWCLPEILLPEGERRELWVVDGRFTADPVDGAELLPGRFALPGFVDAHAHSALGPAKEVLGLVETAVALRRRRDEGVLAVRDLGAPHSVTLRISPEPSLPRMQAAGRWLAPTDRFYPSFHEPVAADDLIAAALAEIAAGAGWVKVIADWLPGELNYDAALLGRLVEAVHGAGARVAAHTAEPCVSEVVAAGVDSIEHGWLLTDADLSAMAARGAALTPTLAALHAPLPDEAPAERVARRSHWLEAARALVHDALERGVTVLAGTDTAGTISDEMGYLVDFGLTPVQALRAATTDARAFLGLPPLEAGAPADVVTFEIDPREDPSVLATPTAVVLGGVRVR